MLSVSPISFNQKTSQNTPNFKGKFGLTGDDVTRVVRAFKGHPNIGSLEEVYVNALNKFVFICKEEKDKTVYETLYDLVKEYSEKTGQSMTLEVLNKF